MLTGHQEKALRFGSHLSVIANAGAGKTTVLVRRFVEILESAGLNVQIRERKGDEINAACGQLRRTQLEPPIVAAMMPDANER